MNERVVAKIIKYDNGFRLTANCSINESLNIMAMAASMSMTKMLERDFDGDLAAELILGAFQDGVNDTMSKITKENGRDLKADIERAVKRAIINAKSDLLKDEMEDYQ